MTLWTRNEYLVGLNLPEDNEKISPERLHVLGLLGVKNMNSKAKHPMMNADGPANPLVYILGENPSDLDDNSGIPFSDTYGQFLRNTLQDKVLDTTFDNIVRTVPTKEITFNDIECFRPTIIESIEKTKPKVIITLGNEVTKWALGDICSGRRMALLRGRKFPCKFGNYICWVVPTYSPFTIINETFDGEKSIPKNEYEKFWMSDIENSYLLAKEQSPENIYEDKPQGKVELYWKGSILPILTYLKEAKGIKGVDIETNALRPFKDNCKILSIAITDCQTGIAFGLDHPEVEYKEEEKLTLLTEFLKFLKSNNSTKVFHNAAFELEWFAYTFGSDLCFENTWHDTMAGAYVLDCRQGKVEREDGSGGHRAGGLSLDFLCKQSFGLDLKKHSKVDRANLENERIEAVLKYNGYDPIYTARLFELQQKELRENDLITVYQDQIKRIPPFVVAQIKGFPVNSQKVLLEKDRWEKQRDENTALLNNSPELIQYKNLYGYFDYGKSECMQKLFKNIFNRKDCERVDKKTGKQVNSFDKKTMEAMNDLPVAQYIQKIKKADHMLSTFVLPLTLDFKKSVLYPDNKVHIKFNLTDTETRRLSAEEPNGQQVPPELRVQFEAPRGYKILNIDFGQQEFRCLAIESQDQEVIRYIKAGTDVHMDWAERIYAKYPETCNKRHGGFETPKQKKKFRSEVKNQFIFAAFYLSTENACANRLEMPIDVFRPIFKEFWEQFYGVKSWQDRAVDFYNRNGYVQSLTGFRRYGPLSRSMVVNSPIQCLGSEILVDGQNRLGQAAYEKKDYNLLFNLNVHDANVFVLPEEKFDWYREFIVKTLVCCPFPFINVPLEVEASEGTNWHDLKKIGVYRTTDFIGNN